MAFTKQGKLKIEKREQERIRLEKVNAILKKHNKGFKEKVDKKKECTELIGMIEGPFFQPSMFIRDPYKWKARSFNVEKQLYSFIRWIYCKYPVPKFMFNIFKSKKSYVHPMSLPPEEYFKWFITVGQGGSFAKEVKGLMTKKEAHIFLNTHNDWPITTNFWRAKCLAAGTTESIARLIHRKFFQDNFIWDEFIHSFCQFISKYKNDISLQDLSDVLDYLRQVHQDNVEYSLKGRTLNSIINASNEWHRQVQIAKGKPRNIQLTSYGVEPWEYEDKKAGVFWTVKQLTTSGQLMNEGRKMHHCVSSYIPWCVAGNGFIFSMESTTFNSNTKHLTIEVDKYGEIIQAKRKFNKAPTKEEETILRRWAAEQLR